MAVLIRTFLLIPLIIFAPSPAHAQEVPAIKQFLQCGSSFPNVPDSDKVACSVNGPQGTIFDDKTNTPVSDAVIHLRVLLSNGSQTEYVLPTDNGSYRFCSLSTAGGITSIGTNQARAVEISFSSPRHSRSRSWKLDPGNPCIQTTQGTAELGDWTLTTIETPSDAPQGYGCFQNGACRAVSSNETPLRSFPNQSSCSEECGVWYLVDQRVLSGTGTTRCYRESEVPDGVTDNPAVIGGPYALKSQCSEREAEPPTPTDTNPPTPTIRPPHPPCIDKPDAEGNLTNCSGIMSGLGIVLSTEPQQFIVTMFTFFLSISGMILLGLLIYSGYQMMVSQGDPEKIKVARERVTSAIIGFLFLVSSIVLLEVIGVNILRLPGFCGESNSQDCQEFNLAPSPTPFLLPKAPTSAPILPNPRTN